MDNNERDRKLDQWLDEALSQYSAAEPRLGLEQRVLANVRADQQSRSRLRGFWRWMPAFAAIAAVLIVMVAVRPYWEAKKAPAKVNSAPEVQSQAADQGKSQDVEAKLQSVVPQKKSAPENLAETRSRQEVTSGKDVALAKNSKAEAEGYTESKAGFMKPAAPAASDSLQVANAPEKTTPAKEADKQVLLDARRDVPAHGNYQSVMSVAAPQPTPVPQKQVVGGVVAGAVSSGAATSSQNSQFGYNRETVEVNPPASQPVQAQADAVTTEQTNAIATEKIAAMPEVTARQMKAMKAKAKPDSPLAKKLQENVDTITIPGMTTLRTDLKNVPLSQQFPSPTPLSEQEKLMMAASKQLKNKPANDEKRDVNDGDIKPIDIKNIEIAPLPGPPK